MYYTFNLLSYYFYTNKQQSTRRKAKKHLHISVERTHSDTAQTDIKWRAAIEDRKLLIKRIIRMLTKHEGDIENTQTLASRSLS